MIDKVEDFNECERYIVHDGTHRVIAEFRYRAQLNPNDKIKIFHYQLHVATGAYKLNLAEISMCYNQFFSAAPPEACLNSCAMPKPPNITAINTLEASEENKTICVRVVAVWRPKAEAKMGTLYDHHVPHWLLLQDDTGFILGRAQSVARLQDVIKVGFTFVFHGQL